MAFSTFILLCNHYQNLPPELFHFVKLKLYQLNYNFLPSFSSPWNPLFYFVSINLTTLGTSCKWNHAVFAFWEWLISFSIYPFAHWWTLGCFHLLAIVSSDAVNMGLQIFWVPVFNSSGYIPRNGTAGSYGLSFLTF